MKCASCQAEIADKAIVCYRCGAPTAVVEPVRRKDVAKGGRRGRLILLVVLLAGVIALLLFTYLRPSL